MLALFGDMTGYILIHISENISLSLENKFQYFLRNLNFFSLFVFFASLVAKNSSFG